METIFGMCKSNGTTKVKHVAIRRHYMGGKNTFSISFGEAKSVHLAEYDTVRLIRDYANSKVKLGAEYFDPSLIYRITAIRAECPPFGGQLGINESCEVPSNDLKDSVIFVNLTTTTPTGRKLDVKRVTLDMIEWLAVPEHAESWMNVSPVVKEHHPNQPTIEFDLNAIFSYLHDNLMGMIPETGKKKFKTGLRIAELPYPVFDKIVRRVYPSIYGLPTDEQNSLVRSWWVTLIEKSNIKVIPTPATGHVDIPVLYLLFTPSAKYTNPAFCGKTCLGVWGRIGDPISWIMHDADGLTLDVRFDLIDGVSYVSGCELFWW